MKPPVPESARRRPVWLALADLYLDTEPQETDLRRLAETCAASGFSWAEIQQINYNEVAPALWFNLHSVAGEWAGWDEQWLVARINSCYTGRPHRSLGSVWLWQRRVDFYTRSYLARARAYLPA